MPDDLTGLRTHQELRLGEIPSGSSSSCCLVDIDGLIWVNDQHGWQVGDSTVQGVAKRLTQTANAHKAEVFRVGSDEFLFSAPTLERTAVLTLATALVDDIRALQMPYCRRDKPGRFVIEFNAAVFALASTFVEQALGSSGLLWSTRDWLASCIYDEKMKTGRSAGVVVDLFDCADFPWGSQLEWSMRSHQCASSLSCRST